MNNITLNHTTVSVENLRLDYVGPLQHIILDPLKDADKQQIKKTMTQMKEIGLTRDDVMETFMEVSFDKIEIPTKIKTAFTREWNKEMGTKKRKCEEMEEMEEMEELEERMEELEL
jgi:hypothetical protein